MSIEEYLLAFEAILYGLIVSRILVKWSQMANEKLSSIYWGYTLLTVNLFLLIVNVFWANQQPQHYEGVDTPLMFLLIVVIPPSLFTFMTYQMFPQIFIGTNIRDYLIEHRNKIFIPWAIYLILQLILLNDLRINPITLASLVLIVNAGFIVKYGKMVWINIFLTIHTLLIIYVYIRSY